MQLTVTGPLSQLKGKWVGAYQSLTDPGSDNLETWFTMLNWGTGMNTYVEDSDDQRFFEKWWGTNTLVGTRGNEAVENLNWTQFNKGEVDTDSKKAWAGWEYSQYSNFRE